MWGHGGWDFPWVLLRGCHCCSQVGLELGVPEPVCQSPCSRGGVCSGSTRAPLSNPSQVVLEVQLQEFYFFEMFLSGRIFTQPTRAI